ncbi:leucine-rich repeat domain-containing protein [Treponema pectinovorum]|uniref:leucine-rich repeat domain-containing protein n=1 Tax=Treponema pectinovorum TaxID=164 RepID=UPI0011CC007B|nr:leucine-rich repeat domain-containing protein [Treponema pectinovorum]
MKNSNKIKRIALVLTTAIIIAGCKATTEDHPNPVIPATSENIANIIKNLQGEGPHKITVTGTITNENIDSIKNELKANSNAKVSLNMSATTNLATLPADAFESCTSLTEIALPSSLTTIDERAFSNCKSLKKIILPSNLKIINGYAFSECSSLEEIILSSSINKIDEGAFNGCKSLKSINIPASVNYLDPTAFSGCSSLKTLTVEEENTKFSSRENIIYTKGQDLLLCAAGGITSANILSSVTEIGEAAFKDCTSLKEVDIPNSVTVIQNLAFYGCSALESVTIPAAVNSLQQSVFKDCTSLKEVAIPNSVVSIENLAFSGCSALESVTIPAAVDSLENKVFDGCTSLKSFAFAKTNSWYRTDNSDDWTNRMNGQFYPVTNPAVNATYFNVKGQNSYWYRKD